MKKFVKETKCENKKLQKKAAAMEKQLETIDEEWQVFDRRRLEEQARLNYKLEMIRQEKRPCARDDCTERRRKYKEAIDVLKSYRNLPSIRSEQDEKRDVKETGTTLHYDMIHGVGRN